MGEEREPKARIIAVNRQQLRLVPMDLETLLPEDHQARAVWAFVERLDLEEFYEVIRSREGSAGRPAIDPQILLGLWILAMLDGVGAAREIERLCQYHLAYQWMCGGVQINHHTLSDFRNLAADRLKGLLTQTVTTLLNAEMVEMKRVAQDGMKVRAWAGSGSFRRRVKLQKLQKMAREQVDRLTEEMEDDPGAGGRREQSARRRSAEERERRLTRALEELDQAEEQRRTKDPERNKKEKRASTTDPEARVMKMPDGGFRPAYNVHLTSLTNSSVIVAVEVNNEGTDQTTMVKLAEQMQDQYGKLPTEWLADAGCTSLQNIDKMNCLGSKVYAPPRRRSDERPRRTDTPAIREWRERMATAEAQEIYKDRAATAELVNAQLHNHGLTQFLVRGAKKALAVVLMHAIANNFRCAWTLA